MEHICNLQETIKNLTSISPSRFTSFQACGLREVWSAGGKTVLLPVSPKAKIGIIIHQMLTEAGRGQLPPDRDTIEQRWKELIDQLQTRIQQSGIEKHMSPLERSVPDLEVRHIRAVRSTLDVAEENRKLPHTPNNRITQPQFGFEIPVKSADGLVRGIVDCATPMETGLLIRDFKSGQVFTDDDLHLREPKRDYQVQLKMYAALYAETFGQWPTKLQIVPLSGSPLDVTFSHEESSALVKEAKELRLRVNAIIASQPTDRIFESLAHPNPTSCSFCQYRPTCRSYRIAVKISEDGWPFDIWGTVQQISKYSVIQSYC